MIWLRRLYNWVLSWSETRFGTPMLFVLALAESSFFPIPPDVLQIALSAGRPRRAFVYATVSLAGSVLGALIGYAIGYMFWSATSWFFFAYVPGITESLVEMVVKKFHANAFLAIWLSAFTPIPYKVFTIAAGVAKIPLWTLIAASVLGRGMRFYLVASLMFFCGPTIRTTIDRYFDLFALLAGVLLVGGFVVVRCLM
ncbi:MAG: YqaA family protein [Thermoguttaceae bacterium]